MAKELRQIAIYGKGGIGKSTTTQNLTAGLVERGNHVMVVGCDPKADSTRLLLGGLHQKTVLDTLRDQGEDDIELDAILKEGFLGTKCVESGGPEPGVGCAGRGIITSIGLLERLGAYTEDLDYVFYDVLGDVVCGGFSMPMRKGYADEVYVVTSGEKMSVYAAANICMAVENFKGRGYASLGGIILNRRGVEGEDEAASQLAKDFGTEIVASIDRCAEIPLAEKAAKPVFDIAPESKAAEQLAFAAERLTGK